MEKQSLESRLFVWSLTPRFCITCGKELMLPGDEHLKCALPHWKLAMRGWAYWLGWISFHHEHSRIKGSEVREMVIMLAKRRQIAI